MPEANKLRKITNYQKQITEKVDFREYSLYEYYILCKKSVHHEKCLGVFFVLKYNLFCRISDTIIGRFTVVKRLIILRVP